MYLCALSCPLVVLAAIPRSHRTVGQDLQNVKKPQTWCDCHWHGLFYFCLFFETYLNNSKPQNRMCDWNVSVLFTNILYQMFLHDSQIWLWGFFTFLVALAHSVPCFAAHGLFFASRLPLSLLQMLSLG